MATIYLNNGIAPVTSDGKLIVGDCCCPSSKCVNAKIGIFYSFYDGDGGEDDQDGIHLCTPAIENRFVRTRDGAVLAESRKGHWSWLDGGSCDLSTANTGKNFVLNGTPAGSGSTWTYELHQGQAVQQGTFEMTRFHLHSAESSANYFRERCSVFLNLLSANTRIRWSLETGIATGSCSSATCTFSAAASGVFDSATFGGSEGWAYQGNSYSYMNVTGGWYLKNFELGITRRPVSTLFTFKVETF